MKRTSFLTLAIALTAIASEARNYRVVTDIMLNNDNCPAMVVWGVKDNDSWRSGSNPLLYNSSQAKKPAWYAVRSALRHRTLVREAEGVEAVSHTDTPARAAVYNLNGQRVASPTKGIFIVNGRKVVRSAGN